MMLQTVTAATRYPVTISEMQAHLRLDATDDDTALAGYIAAATSYVEEQAGLALVQRTYKLFLDGWPVLFGSTLRTFDLPMPPLVSVTHVKTYDDLDAATTMDSADYFVDTAESRLVLRTDASWPIPTRAANGIEIQWVAGYATIGAIPENLRHAIILTVAHWFANREPVNVGNIVNTLPMGVEPLIAMSRQWRL